MATSKDPMTKAEIIDSLAKDSGITKAQAQAVFNSLVELCRSEVQDGRTFRLSGLGSFSLKESKARTGVNPATGEKIEITAKKRMAFKAGAKIQATLNPTK